MQRCETLSNGQIEVRREQTHADQITVTITISRAPADSAEEPDPLGFGPPDDPVFYWAQFFLFGQMLQALSAQSNVLTSGFEAVLDWHCADDRPVVLHDIMGLLSLLERSTRREVIDLLRAPSVLDAIGSMAEGDSSTHCQRRLAKIMKRNFPAAPGAPPKAAEKRVDVQTARRVRDLGLKLRPAFMLVDERRKRGGDAADPENLERELVKLPGIKASWAKHLARRRTTPPLAVCRIVADEMKKSVKAVYKAAERGWDRDASSPVATPKAVA